MKGRRTVSDLAPKARMMMTMMTVSDTMVERYAQGKNDDDDDSVRHYGQ